MSDEPVLTVAWALAFLEELSNDLQRHSAPLLPSEKIMFRTKVIPLLKQALADPCLQKLQPGQPFWVCKAGDRSAPLLVDIWCNMHQVRLGKDHPKIVGGRQIAEDMRAWPVQKDPD